jgi:hypothetical protein
MDGTQMVKARQNTLQYIPKLLLVEVTGEVGLQDVIMETGKVEGIAIQIIIILE